MVESERARLLALHSLAILDTPPEERFDRITRLATSIFDVDIALVSLVDEERQWFKSRQGISLTQTCRKESFLRARHSRREHLRDRRCQPRFPLC